MSERDPSHIRLIDFADEYTLERGVSRNQRNMLVNSSRQLGEWLGRPVMLSDLSDDVLNGWLQHIECNSGWKADTIFNKRRHIMTLWLHAHRKRLVPNLYLYIRPAPRERPVPEAWTTGELRQIIAAARGMKGLHWFDVTRAEYWDTCIQVAYQTGLRKSDVLSLNVTLFNGRGVYRAIQSKTKQGHAVQIDVPVLEAMQVISEKIRHGLLSQCPEDWLIASRIKRAVHEPGCRYSPFITPQHATVFETIEEAAEAGYEACEHCLASERKKPAPSWQTPLAWPHQWREMKVQWRQICAVAGVRHGCFQKVRRTGATACEIATPGAAPRYCGHLTPDLAYQRYVDRGQLPIIRPPSLENPEL